MSDAYKTNRKTYPGTQQPVLDDDLATKDYVDQNQGIPPPSSPQTGDVLTFDGTDWIAAAPGGGGVNELEFLQQKAADGKLRNVTGSASATGAIITITPPNGVTTVVVKAIVTPRNNAGSISTVSLIIDGVTISSVAYVTISNNSAANDSVSIPHELLGKGQQLVGDGIKTITISANNGSPTLNFASIEAYDL